MGKFLKSMIVLLAIVAMATPVMAEDMLSLGGQMRVRGWYVDDGSNATDTWADQRLRMGGKFSVADGVSVTFRFDVTEGNWGSGDNTYGTGRNSYEEDGHGSTIHFDRAHLDLDFDSFSLRAGQQYVGFSQSGAFNAQDAGITIKTKGAVPVTAFFMLADDDDDNADGFYYGANVGFGADNFKGNFFVAAQNKVNDEDEDVYLIGADAKINLDAVKIVAELDFFTGDEDDNDDAFGTQLFVDASMAASENMTFGGQLYYALGDDTDTQYVVLGNDFGGWDPLFALGTGLDNEQIGAGRPFDLFGDNSGVIAGRLYTSVKASDAATISASITYATPEEDANVDADSALALAAGMKYALMANTSLGVQVEYIDVDESGVDEVLQAGVGLFVNF